MTVDEGVCAVRPGTDIGRHARMLARVHDALLAGDRPPATPRRLVARSWERVRAQGVGRSLGAAHGGAAHGGAAHGGAAHGRSALRQGLRRSLGSPHRSAEAARTELRRASREIDRAVAKGALNKRAAARRKSRLARAVNANASQSSS